MRVTATKIENKVKKIGIIDEDEINIKYLRDVLNKNKQYYEVIDVTKKLQFADIFLLCMDNTRKAKSIIKKVNRVNTLASILVISNNQNEKFVEELVLSGVSGYLPKRVVEESLLNAVHNLKKYRAHLPTRYQRYLLEEIRNREKRRTANNILLRLERRDLFSLTGREFEVYQLMVQGYSNEEIANILYISDKTAKNHTHKVIKKLGADNRTNAVVMAFKNGWVI